MMSFYDWDSDPEPDEPAQLHVPQEILPTPEGQPEELDEVERRLEKAYYYRMLLRHQLIDSNSDQAIEVENEIQTFVHERLGVLLGMKPEKQETDFSDEEVQALKAVAAKVLNRPAIVLAKDKDNKPTMAIKPLQEKAIQPVRPAQPVQETPKPVMPPVPVKRGRGRPRKALAPQTTAPATYKTEAPQQKEELADGERIETIGGKRYKVVNRVVNDPATGQPKLDKQGHPVMAEHRIDITPKAVIPNRQPFPSLEVMNAMEAARAQEVLAANPIAAGLIPTAMSMTPKED